MNHMDEGLLQAYVDEELGGDERVTVERHLGDCLTCRAELRELRSAAEDLSRGLLLLDAPAPEARKYAVAEPRRPAKRGAWGLAALPRAAVLVLGLGTAAAAMVPGSPLYRWIHPEAQTAQVATAERAATTQPEAPTAAVTMAAPAESGVSIEPLDGEVRVVVRAASALRIRASIGDSPRAGVFATGPAADARFDAAPGRIEITGADSGELRVEMPRAAATTIVVNGRDYLRAANGQIHLSAPAEARAETEVVFHP
jgi:hypothetical protein